jgi:hypothetical protein
LAGEKLTIKSEAVDPGEELGRLEKDTRAYAAELRAAGATGERKKLESELVELTDRETLGAYLATITEEVKRLKDLEFIKDCLGDLATNAITNLGNQIADDVITPKLRDRFQEEIVKLAAEKVRVEIVRTGGRYGSPQYQIRFFAKPDAKIREILSEGEQTIVELLRQTDYFMQVETPHISPPRKVSWEADSNLASASRYFEPVQKVVLEI